MSSMGDTGRLQFAALLVVQIMAASALIVVIFLWGGPVVWMRIAGTALAVVSIALLFTARFQLGRSFAVKAQARELVVHGIYSRIRNPIYVFGTFFLAGVALALQKPELYWAIPAVIVMQVIRARREAKVLEEKFGETYRQYRARTWF
jgi:protein-S-isoprenylcysteine O-methyltransferase Ste14